MIRPCFEALCAQCACVCTYVLTCMELRAEVSSVALGICNTLGLITSTSSKHVVIAGANNSVRTCHVRTHGGMCTCVCWVLCVN